MPYSDRASIAITGLFNTASKEALERMHDANITEAAVSGQDTGYIPRADQVGHHRMQEIRQAEEEEDEYEFRLLLSTIANLSDRISEGLSAISDIINDLYDLAAQLLDDINAIHDQIKQIVSTHNEALKVLAQGPIEVADDGTLKDESLRKLIKNYQKRTGDDHPKGALETHLMINEQIEYERSTLIPWLEEKAKELSQLHSHVISGVQETSQSYSHLNEENDRVQNLPDNHETVNKLEELNQAVEVQRKEAEYLKESSKTERDRIDQEILKATENNTIPSTVLKEKASDFEKMDDFSFSPVNSTLPNQNPIKPGH